MATIVVRAGADIAMVGTSHAGRLHHRRTVEHPGQFSADRTSTSWSVFNERQQGGLDAVEQCRG